MQTLKLMGALDSAWNERRWDDYASVLHANFKGYRAGEKLSHDKETHVAMALGFITAFPDAKVEREYIDFFESKEGNKSVSVSTLKGKMTGSIQINGRGFEPNGNSLNVTFATISLWKDGKLVEQRSFLDETTMFRQISFH